MSVLELQKLTGITENPLYKKGEYFYYVGDLADASLSDIEPLLNGDAEAKKYKVKWPTNEIDSSNFKKLLVYGGHQRRLHKTVKTYIGTNYKKAAADKNTILLNQIGKYYDLLSQLFDFTLSWVRTLYWDGKGKEMTESGIPIEDCLDDILKAHNALQYIMDKVLDISMPGTILSGMVNSDLKRLKMDAMESLGRFEKSKKSNN